MIVRTNISAGELFELIRPAVLVLSALISTLVFATARRRQFSILVVLAWAVATLVFPLIVVPVYLIALFRHKQHPLVTLQNSTNATVVPAGLRWRAATLVYAVVLLSGLGIYWYRDYQDVDSHLARAVQANIRGDRNQTIEEYRRALRLDDNAHTHKLLAKELAEVGFLSEALGEFRLAEKGGEPDDLTAYYIAALLDALNHPNQATLEYQRFLQTKACLQDLPDYHCEAARRRADNN